MDFRSSVFTYFKSLMDITVEPKVLSRDCKDRSDITIEQDMAATYQSFINP